ncbi:MAG: TenA family protein [Pikeienuella sp.]
MSYGVVFPKWRAAAGADWAAYTRHAFVEGLGDGTLPREAFLRYLTQDYVFLVHFARAWALALTKADTIEEMRFCATTVHGLIVEEMRLHVRLCAEAGIDEATLFAAEEAPQNLAYTRYVLDAGHSGDFVDLLAALAPCVLGYGEIGARLAQGPTGAAWRDWIDAYAGPEYQALCATVGGLIDDAVARRLGDAPERAPRWDGLCRRFRMATRLEVGFWDMGLGG